VYRRMLFVFDRMRVLAYNVTKDHLPREIRETTSVYVWC
jgi:hypothetical protein